MGRTITTLNTEFFEHAVAYLHKAQLRNPKAFVAPAQVGFALARLEGQLYTLKEPDAAVAFRAWLDLYLSPRGRISLLNALRRKRADSKPGRARRRIVALPPDAYVELNRLSKSLGGTPLPQLIAQLAALANGDAALKNRLLGPATG